jgi:hypothetical protein
MERPIDTQINPPSKDTISATFFAWKCLLNRPQPRRNPPDQYGNKLPPKEHRLGS